MNRPVYKLLDWIDESKLNWKMLSVNKNATGKKYILATRFEYPNEVQKKLPL